MAGYYKFKIEKKEDGYRFFLLPSNNNDQPVGISAEAYTSYEDCKKALEEFRSFVSLNPADSLLHAHKVSGSGDWDSELVYDGKVLFKRRRPTPKKDECEKWAERIKKHINATLIH